MALCLLIPGTKQVVGGEEESSEADSSSSGPSLVNRQLVLPSFIPPKFSVSDENCLIKPSEYLKSIGGNRSVSGSAHNTLQEKHFTKCLEQKLNQLEDTKVAPSNGPPPPPLPCTLEKQSETDANKPPEVEVSKTKKQQQPLSAISIHDLNSVQLKRTVVHKTMSSPMKPNHSGKLYILVFTVFYFFLIYFYLLHRL